MPFTLIIQLRLGQEGGESSERVFDQQVVTIGRAATADLVLIDPRRMVSSCHGEIRRRGDSWSVVDLGSTNGTALNEIRLTARNEYALKDGDRITLGNFQLTFKTAVSLPDACGASPPGDAQHGGSLSGDEIQALAYSLRRAYADTDYAGAENREDYLRQVLRRAVESLDRQSVQVRVESLRRILSSVSGSREPENKPRPVVPSLPVPPAVHPDRGGHDMPDLMDVVRAVLGPLDPPLSRSQSDQVVRRIEQVLRVVCAGVADAIKGRREFQREFEVEATRILDWSPNPIKQAETAGEIASLLLDPRSTGVSEEQAKAYLQEVFEDLTLHQLGLMAGFRECVRGLLKEFDPVLLVPGEKKRSAAKGLELLSGKGVRADAAAWQRFLEKYRQLTEEEVRVFERILAPHFSTGYLSIQKTRRKRR